MLLFGEKIDIGLSISESNALESSLEQTIELLKNLIDDGQSFIAIKDNEYYIKFTAIKNYLFFVEIPMENLFGAKEGYFTRIKAYGLARDLYNGKKIKDIKNLIFKSYL